MKRLVVCFVSVVSAALAFAEGEAPVTSYDEQPAQFVEYLESMDGACRIDTEYVFKTEPRMVTTMWLKDSQDYDVAGTPLNVAGNFIVDFNDSLQKLWYRYGSVNAQTPMYTTNDIPQLGPICGRWVKCDWGRVCYLDGIKLCEQTSSSALASFANNEQTFSVFAGRRNVATALKVKFRDVQLYDGGVLVRDLRPALRQNGDPCYYDTITRRCYVNVGREYDGKGRLAAFPAGGQARIKTFVEYLHSPGSCTIDTGYVFQEKPRVKTTMRLLSVADSDVCGTGQAMDGCFIIDVDDSRHKVFLRYGKEGNAGENCTWTPFVTNQWVECDWHTNICMRIEGETDPFVNFFYKTPGTFPKEGVGSFRVFSSRTSMPGVEFRDMAVYDGWDAYGRWKLVRYLKPAIDANDRPCFYDLVTQSCYYNSGKGTLTAGPEVGEAPPTEFVDWLANDAGGNVRLDTGYVFNDRPTVKTTMMLDTTDDKDVAGFANNVAPSFILDYSELNLNYYRYGSTASKDLVYMPIRGAWAACDWGYVFGHDGVRVGGPYSDVSFAGNTQTFRLFGARTGSPGVRFKETWMYERDTLVRDLVPALDASGVPCFYDYVGMKHYYNSGSGAFVVGPRRANTVNAVTGSVRDSHRILPGEDYVVVRKGMSLSDVKGASARADDRFPRSPVTACFVADDPENPGEKTIQFQSCDSLQSAPGAVTVYGDVFTCNLRLKQSEDGKDILAKVDSRGRYRYAHAADGDSHYYHPACVGVVDYYAANSEWSAFNWGRLRNLVLWGDTKPETRYTAMPSSGVQLTIADGGVLNLPATQDWSGWVDGTGDVRFGGAAGAADERVDIAITNRLTGDLIIDAASVRLTSVKSVSPDFGNLAIVNGATCRMEFRDYYPADYYKDYNNGLGGINARIGIRVAGGSTLDISNNCVSVHMPIDVDDSALSLRGGAYVPMLTLRNGAMVTNTAPGGGLQTCYFMTNGVFWSSGVGTNIIASHVWLYKKIGAPSATLTLITDADLRIDGDVNDRAYPGSDIVKLGAATLTLASAANDFRGRLVAEQGTVALATSGALNSDVSHLALCGGALACAANTANTCHTLDLAVACGPLTVPDRGGEIELESGAALTVTSIGEWETGAPLVLKGDLATSTLVLPPLADEQLALIRVDGKPRWIVTQDADGRIRPVPPGVLLIFR